MSASTAVAPRRKSLIGCQSGAAGIEFALLMPVLVLFLTGSFAVSWAVHGISSVNYALEQTGRMLQTKANRVPPVVVSISDLQTAIDIELSHLGRQAVTLTMTQDAPNGVKMAHITAQYNFPIKIPLLTTYNISYQRTTTVVLPQS